MKRNTNNLAALLKQKERVFHTQDLAVIWEITNKNTLYTAIKRYCQKGILRRIFKGLYTTVPVSEISPLKMGAKALHKYCYITTETVLQEDGFLNQAVFLITFVSNQSRRFSIEKNEYKSRKLKDKYLYNPTGIIEKDGVKRADIFRAIADMLYFNPHAYFDKNVNWAEVKKVQKAVGYPLTAKRYVDSGGSGVFER